MALELNASKHRIYEYVESRMSFIAPNLSIIIGASTAAKIMGETLGQSGVRGLSLDSATSGTLRPSVRWDTGPRAPAPRPLALAVSALLEITEVSHPASPADMEKGWQR